MSSTAGALTSSTVGALTTSSAGALAASSISTIPVVPLPPVAVRLEATNFVLWKGLLLPNLAGVGLHGFLDGSYPAPALTLTQGEGDKETTIPNPAYHQWWTQDQRVLGLLLGSMDPDIACQLIGCKTSAASWTAVHALYGAQSRANVRHIRRQLQSTRKEDLTAAAYMHKMKALADAMAAAGAPISDDELADYIITGLGSAYNSIAASLTVGNKSVPYTDFYSHILSFESLQAQQAQVEEWASSAHAASRFAPVGNPGRPRMQDYSPPYQSGNPVHNGGNRPYG